MCATPRCQKPAAEVCVGNKADGFAIGQWRCQTVDFSLIMPARYFIARPSPPTAKARSREETKIDGQTPCVLLKTGHVSHAIRCGGPDQVRARPCKSTPVTGAGGGAECMAAADGSGAPQGARNGNYKHGRYTKEGSRPRAVGFKRARVFAPQGQVRLFSSLIDALENARKTRHHPREALRTRQSEGHGHRRLSRLLAVLVVVDLGKLRVDHVVLLQHPWPRSPSGLLLVHRLAELHGNLRQRVWSLALIASAIVALQRFLQITDGRLRWRGDRSRGFFEPCSASAFSVECTRPSAWFLASTRFAALLVLGRVGLGVLDHLLDVGFRQAAGCLDAKSAAPCRSPCPWPKH